MEKLVAYFRGRTRSEPVIESKFPTFTIDEERELVEQLEIPSTECEATPARTLILSRLQKLHPDPSQIPQSDDGTVNKQQTTTLQQQKNTEEESDTDIYSTTKIVLDNDDDDLEGDGTVKCKRYSFIL